MTSTQGLVLVLTVVVALMVSCATAPSSREDKQALLTKAATRMQQMNTEDPEVGALVKRGYGYTLFPKIGKGGLVVGAAYGRGWCTSRGSTLATVT